MKLGDGIRRAVAERDWALMTRLVDYLRYKHGFTCECTRQYFEKMTGQEISLPAWNEWMMQCDEISGMLTQR